MANNRDLAQIVYATTLGRASASRIWRTVVVAGAMLGSPLASGQTPPTKAPAATEPAKPAPPPAAGAPAMPSKEESAAAAKAAVKNLEAEAKELDKQIAATTKSIKAAKTPADKEPLNATLAEQKTAKENLKAKLTTARADAKKADAEAKAEARAKNPPRPRTNNTRPVGRGFILS